MSWSGLDTVHGLAIDSQGTLAHHQIISVDKKLQRVNYSVFYEPTLKNTSYSQDIMLKFIDVMQTTDPQSEEEWDLISQSYSDFMSEIRRHGPNSAFNLNVPAKALTFDLAYDDNFMPLDLSFRPTIGIMDRAITCGEAKREMSGNKNLQIIQKVAANLPSNRSQKPISFEMVTFHLTQYIAEQKLAQDFSKGKLDTIFRTIEKKTHPDLAPNMAQETRYYSLMSYMNQNGQDMLRLPKNAVTPITASRVAACHYNIMETGESLVNGKSPFPENTAQSFAQYKMIRKLRPNNGHLVLCA